MAEADIPVDLFNPGQVFACLGFLEAAEILLGDAEGGFDWSDEAKVRFILRAAGQGSPVDAVLDFLAEAKVNALVPSRSNHRTEKWQVPTCLAKEGEPFPFPDPPSPATLPALLTDGNTKIVIDYWGDTTVRDNAKFWAGAGGYPGAALARDALNLVRQQLTTSTDGLFDLAKPLSSSFRLDWRRDYIPIEVGFSPNEHGDVNMMGYPLVELLAAIGLGHARPQRLTKLEYRYGVVGGTPQDGLVDPILLRAALGCARLPIPQRTFHMQLAWPGQENQARCILDVVEETNP
jgi:CRISPR-associated protein Csx14